MKFPGDFFTTSCSAGHAHPDSEWTLPTAQEVIRKKAVQYTRANGPRANPQAARGRVFIYGTVSKNRKSILVFYDLFFSVAHCHAVA